MHSLWHGMPLCLLQCLLPLYSLGTGSSTEREVYSFRLGQLGSESVSAPQAQLCLAFT